MSDNNNMTILAVLAVAYLYMRRQQQTALAYNATKSPTGAPVASMPGNVGTGWQQIASGAIGGFLQSLAKGPTNNTSTTVFPSYATNDSAVLQDVVYRAPDASDLIDANDFSWYA